MVPIQSKWKHMNQIEKQKWNLMTHFIESGIYYCVIHQAKNITVANDVLKHRSNRVSSGINNYFSKDCLHIHKI